MEHGKRKPESAAGSRRHEKHGRSVAKSVAFGIGTLILVGICSLAMLAGIFMMYVKTTLAPTLKIDADDYTMKLSSII